jgi:hypothetical protein
MIFETNETFPLDRMTLLTPKPITGGNHFSRFHIDDSPVFVHLPKCTNKQGIQTSGTKKAYMDLQFTNDQERFLKWLENLIEKVQEVLCQNSASWFANEMDKVEIEDTFQSPLKPYRSGQMYLMRVNIPIRMGKIVLPMFDEDENQIESDMVKAGNTVLGILEIQGLKFSAKSLQLEMEMKQLLVLPSLSLFEKCVLTVPHKTPISHPTAITPPAPAPNLLQIESPQAKTETKTETETETETENLAITFHEPTPESIDNHPEPQIEPQIEPEVETETEKERIPEPLEEPKPEPEDKLEDVDICLENMTLQPIEKLQLKNSKEIYYKMYRQARQKAKLARDLAISSYLESKHIKNVYVLEDLSDDEDEVSFFTTDSKWKKQENEK